MSEMTVPAVRLSAVPNAKPFTAGHDPRRARGPMSAAEREFRRVLEDRHIPRASELLDAVFEAGMAGDARMAELFFKVCGLVIKPNDDAKLQTLARDLLDGMIAEAKARKRAELETQGRIVEVGTDED